MVQVCYVGGPAHGIEQVFEPLPVEICVPTFPELTLSRPELTGPIDQVPHIETVYHHSGYVDTEGVHFYVVA